jgi:hypothetical protein
MLGHWRAVLRALAVRQRIQREYGDTGDGSADGGGSGSGPQAGEYEVIE